MSPVILTSSLKRGRQQPDRRKESHELTSWLGSCFSLPIYRSLSLLWGFVCSEQTETFTQHTIIPIASARQFKCEEFKQRVEIFYNLCLSSATNTETPMTSTHTIAFQWIGRITGHWRRGKKHIFAKQCGIIRPTLELDLSTYLGLRCPVLVHHEPTTVPLSIFSVFCSNFFYYISSKTCAKWLSVEINRTTLCDYLF